jgi:ABC-2 type transport system permease protein
MRYFKLFALFLKRSVMLGLEYRANLIGGLLASAFDGAWSFVAALMLYSFRDTIGGWNFYETLVVVGMLFVSSGFLYVFVWPNMQSIVEHIRTGSMDFILTKPLNSQWHATFNYFKLESASSIVAGVALMAYALVQLRVSPNVGQIILFIALALGGLVILYALLTLMVTFSFWAVETGEIMQLIYLLLETGRYPAPTLPQPMRTIVTFIIPIAFVTTVPAEVLLGKVTSAWVGWCWVFAAGLLFASTQLWKLGVRRYNSASS